MLDPVRIGIKILGKQIFIKKKGILFRFMLVIFPQDVTLSSFTQDLMKVLPVLI